MDERTVKTIEALNDMCGAITSTLMSGIYYALHPELNEDPSEALSVCIRIINRNRLKLGGIDHRSEMLKQLEEIKAECSRLREMLNEMLAARSKELDSWPE
jgi:ribonuclease PH